MSVIRTLAAVGLAFVAYKHASMWGRFFMNLHGMKSSAEVSIAYLRPTTRFGFFHLPQVTFLVAIWLLWPYGHWGLAAILVSVWAFKAGMRCELLRSFVRQLLLHLDDGLALEEAWGHADSTIRAVSGIQNPNINRYAADPAALVRYVVAITRSRHEASEIENRWVDWLTTQATASAVEDERV